MNRAVITGLALVGMAGLALGSGIVGSTQSHWVSGTTLYASGMPAIDGWPEDETYALLTPDVDVPAEDAAGDSDLDPGDDASPGAGVESDGEAETGDDAAEGSDIGVGAGDDESADDAAGSDDHVDGGIFDDGAGADANGLPEPDVGIGAPERDDDAHIEDESRDPLDDGDDEEGEEDEDSEPGPGPAPGALVS